MSNEAQFSASRLEEIFSAAADNYRMLSATADQKAFDGLAAGDASLTAECISITVSDRKLCFKLPAPISKDWCITVPSWIPDGTAAQACLSVCYKFGIPMGVKVTVTVAGSVIYQQTFGLC